jgi:hypothetical protein
MRLAEKYVCKTDSGYVGAITTPSWSRLIHGTLDCYIFGAIDILTYILDISYAQLQFTAIITT